MSKRRDECFLVVLHAEAPFKKKKLCEKPLMLLQIKNLEQKHTE